MPVELSDLELALQGAFLAARDCLLAEGTLEGWEGLDGLVAAPWRGFLTLSPFGAERLGLVLAEHGEGNPVWDWAGIPERPVILVGEPGHRRLARPNLLRDSGQKEPWEVASDHETDEHGRPLYVNPWGSTTVLFGQPALLDGVYSGAAAAGLELDRPTGRTANDTKRHGNGRFSYHFGAFSGRPCLGQSRRKSVAIRDLTEGKPEADDLATGASVRLVSGVFAG